MDDDNTRGSKRQRVLQDDVFFLYEGGKVAEERRRELTRVRVGAQVKDIPPRTFRGCTNLTEVQFVEEGALYSIGECAFGGCKALEQVTIPSSVAKLGTCAFCDCINLAHVQLNDGLNIIGDDAFSGCEALQQMAIPTSVTKLGSGSFRDCSNLTALQVEEGALQFIGNRAFCDCTALQQVTIPSSVTKLGDGTFKDCTNLAEVQLNEGLHAIGECVFVRCTASRSVTVPPSVTKLGRQKFTKCTNLSEVILLGGDSLLNQGFLDRGISSEEGVLSQILNQMIGCRGNSCSFAFFKCPLTTIKISVPGILAQRMTRLPQEFRLSIEGRIRDLHRIELTQDGNILACFPVIRGTSGVMDVEDTNNQTAESLHQVLRLISFHELKESSILIELAMWKSRLDEGRARTDCRVSVPDPAKWLIMEYCGFAEFLEPAIEGT